MLIPGHPCAQLPASGQNSDISGLVMMPRNCHSQAQYHAKHFRSPQIAETCEKILGRDFKITSGLRVKLSDAGKEYLRLWDKEHGTDYLDDGIGTVVYNGREAYMGMCTVKWDSGRKPIIDNTYYVYNCGNDGLYHLALAEEPAWSLEPPDELGLREQDRQKLQSIRENSARSERNNT
ncbi:hypothetical protein GUITHDRAFT_165960 [Guillardia theta CCMP2712]|uniref:Uncharacterized protein n=1 Tax=Guillardia theta (strain CCMP2712) TaxID=905079 RepID=L1IHV2_GUITC|nr:hypothetical protein GUITHDRAFT_165960 [Guillardia theta CCMP2712]EKX35524.1 hypothetical protein GUITHDRAFT_165960 [Guillardia theta CCMP2712]|eukprot:XP_005822504.1 hypothetical protein GUITHDRAFT_165960 [Guillardia theta CCMP2712]